MSSFKNIRELTNALQKGARLLDDMFRKRKTMSISYDTALEMLDEKENYLQLLIKDGVIEVVDDKLEITEPFMRFFEEILDANETINVAMVEEYISGIRLDIDSCMAEETPNGRGKYLRSLRNRFRHIATITQRNIIDLKRLAENTYKQESNYNIKKMHLERLDERRIQIGAMIMETEKLIDNESGFMNTLADVALRQTIGVVKRSLHESAHSMIEIERLIIDYLNKIEYQNKIIKKVRTLKYLKDQVMIESQTNIAEVMAQANHVWFEPDNHFYTKVSLTFLRNDDSALYILENVRRQIKRKLTITERLSAPLMPESLVMSQEEQRAFDHYELINSFEAQGNDLFKFVWRYDFHQPTTEEQRLVLFLQLASQFASRLNITEATETIGNITYPIIHINTLHNPTT